MTGNRNTQEKEMTQDELRHFIANNMPEGMMAVINFNTSEKWTESISALLIS